MFKRFKNLKIKTLLVHLIVTLAYPAAKAITSEDHGLLVFCDVLTIVAGVLLIAGVVYGLAIHGDFDIAGYTFTKDGKDAWTVPAGKGNIPAKGYLVFVAKNSDPNEGPAFGLSGTKGFILCMYKSDDTSDANLVDKIDNSATAETFKTVEDGKSLGRKTDGADEWVIFDTPTLGSANK